MEDLRRRIEIARGDREADLLLVNARVANVFSGEVIEGTNVAVSGRHVAGVGAHLRKGRTVIDVGGKSTLIPGLIDAHIHVESSHLSLPEFARAVVPHGTTAIVCDPHEIANVLGLDGLRYVVETSRALPLDVFVMASSCVPATAMETSGASLDAAAIAAALREERVIGLAEVMNFPGVIGGDSGVLAKIVAAAGLPVDGHAPGVVGPPLVAYATAGIESDHESTTAAEALEKLRLGMWVIIREGTAAKNLDALVPSVSDANWGRFCFCSDDRSAVDIAREGHVDAILRKAVARGLDPVRAVTMATLNAATRFRLGLRGAVAPGYLADLVVVNDLREFRVETVIKSGRVVVERGHAAFDARPGATSLLRRTVNVSPLDATSFRIPARGTNALAIEIVPDQIVTRRARVPVVVRDGEVIADPDRDVAKLAVVERHHATGRIGLGLVKGFGLRGGAMASTFAHDSHNLIVVGDDDRDMRLAAERVIAIGGGYAVASRGAVRAEVPFAIAGVMSSQPFESVVRACEECQAACRALGATPRDPFLTLSFLALPVIPDLKLTDHGLVDVTKFRVIDLFDTPPTLAG
ncbi:MAG: adenine deaminase [Planctomycetes bacterium]|nr:adenine deaminase [Planctomycetota bacterium]